MLRAIKANRVVRIPDEKKNAYIAMGYKIESGDGKTVIHNPLDNTEDVQALKAEIKKRDEIIERLEAEIARLTGQSAPADGDEGEQPDEVIENPDEAPTKVAKKPGKTK